jgi:hypothetical protein
MKKIERDRIAENIAEYDSLSDQERGQFIAQVLEDQPYLMGFVTNLADDFSEKEHEALVDSVLILINAFIATGIPVDTIPDPMIQEVLQEKIEAYEAMADKGEVKAHEVSELADSPLTFEDLRHRALAKSDLAQESVVAQYNFMLVLDALITIVERSILAQDPADKDQNDRK